MKIVLVLLNAFLLCMSISIKDHKSIAQIATQDPKLDSYARAIFKELNNYRRENHFGPYISWMPGLAKTTIMEAQNIADKHNFGEHSRFQEWQKSVSNKYFTELSVLIDTQGEGLPSKQVFGLTVMFALEEKEKFYLIHAYTQGAAAVIQNPKNKNQYIAVLHLMKKNKIFSSCKEAKDLGVQANKIQIMSKGKKITVECSNEYDGGWTLIHEMNKELDRVSTTEINDLGLSYTQLYMKTESDHVLDIGKNTGGKYLSKGFNFVWNFLRFDDTWYAMEETDYHGNLDKLKHGYYSIKTIQKIGSSNQCSFGGPVHLDWCAPAFIMLKTPPGRITGISDVEAFAGDANADNRFHYHFKLYVR